MLIHYGVSKAIPRGHGKRRIQCQHGTLTLALPASAWADELTHAEIRERLAHTHPGWMIRGYALTSEERASCTA